MMASSTHHHRVWATSGGATATKDALRLEILKKVKKPEFQNTIRLDEQFSTAANENAAADYRSRTVAVVVAPALTTMEELVTWTLQHNLLPKVVAEFPGITVGGAIAGGGVESSSGKFGLFSDTVAWIQVQPQVQLSAGEITTTKRGDELWGQLCCTFGAQGCVILAAGVECIALRSRRVRVTYYNFGTVKTACDALVSNATADASVDFVDGLQWPRQYGWGDTSCAVVMVGRILDANPTSSTTSCHSHGWKRPVVGGSFYYEHVLDLVQKYLIAVPSTHQPHGVPFATETMDIVDYLFRYDAGAFWMARPMTFEWKYFLLYFPFTLAMFVASHRWMRWITGWVFSSSRRLYRMLQFAPASAIASKLILQDLYVPAAQAPRLVNRIRDTLPLSVPLWLCPVQTNDNQPFSPSYYNPDPSSGRVVLINCGVYGRVKDGHGAFHTQHLEEVCVALGGRKMLYGHSYYSRATFGTVYGSSALAQALFTKTCHAPNTSTATALSWKERIASWIL